jgi:hypothetical protein
MPPHVRSWRKWTLHRHRNMCGKCQRIAELEAEIEELQRQALVLGAEPSADFAPWVLLGVKIAARGERALRKACLWGGACPRCILGSHVRTG